MWKLVPIFLICIAVAFFSDRFSRKNERLTGYIYKEKFIWIIAVIAMVLFAGLRIQYNDTGTYLAMYEATNADFDFSDIVWTFGGNFGFAIVNILLKSLGFSKSGYLMVYSIVTYGIYVWFIHKYSTDFLMSIFLATSFTAFFTVSFASSTTGAFAISAAASFASSITAEAFTVVFSTVSLTASVAFVVASLIVSFALEVVLFLIIISYSN